MSIPAPPPEAGSQELLVQRAEAKSIRGSWAWCGLVLWACRPLSPAPAVGWQDVREGDMLYGPRVPSLRADQPPSPCPTGTMRPGT